MGKGANANMTFCEQLNKADAQKLEMPSRVRFLITSTHNTSLIMLRRIVKGEKWSLVYMLIFQTF